MNMKEAFISVFANWLNFRGRACRSEYWYIYLSTILIVTVLTILEKSFGIYSDEWGAGSISFLLPTFNYYSWHSSNI